MRKTTSYNVEESILARIKDRTEETGESASEVVNLALDHYLREREYRKEFARMQRSGIHDRALAAIASMAAYEAGTDR